MKRLILFSLLCVMPMLRLTAQGQHDSIDVALITCSPGNEIYSLYGHTALRLRNYTRKLDIAFNYGVFSFEQPHFLWRFVLGQCDYMVMGIPWDIFLEEYEERGSSVTQQSFNMTSDEANRLWFQLLVNCQPSNCKYRYNYFYNNCTTKVRDVVESAIAGHVEYGGGAERQPSTYRELLHGYTRHYPWVAEGCDILLGADVDQMVSARASQFLPEMLMHDVAEGTIHGDDGEVRPLLKETEIILHKRPRPTSHKTISPHAAGWAFVILCLLIAGVEQWRRCWLWGWDVFLLTLRGLAGSLITFLALFSEHPAVDSNWLVVLLNPLAFAGLYMVVKAALRHTKTHWFTFDLVNLLLFALFFLLGVQEFGELVVPLTLAFVTRPINYYICMRRAARQNSTK